MGEAARNNGTPEEKPPTRDNHGRYLKGHKEPGPGNPGVRNLQAFRSVIAKATDPEKLRLAWVGLQNRAVEGEPWAVKELFDRVFGKAAQVIILDDDNNIAEDSFRNWFESMMRRPRVMRAIEAEVLDEGDRSA